MSKPSKLAMTKIRITAFYKFTALSDYQQLRRILLNKCHALNIKGTILLANEGINATIAGTDVAITNFLTTLQQYPALANLVYKDSWAEEVPFYRMKVKLKKEIVTLGIDNIDPNQICGQYVPPQEWNELISDPEVITIDTRNTYEIAIGTFKHAIDPKTTNFREFPDYVANNLKTYPKDTKIAMFCTGGIRCEKSTAYLMQQGFKNVYHLEGGILNYLEQVPANESLWQGECFVFDNRVAVKPDLTLGSYDQCYGCRHPISTEDKASPYYAKDIYCPHCYQQQSKTGLSRRTERHRQLLIAEEKNIKHLGVPQAQHI